MAYLQVNISSTDLKTANVLRCSGTHKLCDFGLVRCSNVEQERRPIGARAVLGKRSIEKWMCYAFGVLLGEVMTGEVPFLGYDYADLKRKVLAASGRLYRGDDCPGA